MHHLLCSVRRLACVVKFICSGRRRGLAAKLLVALIAAMATPAFGQSNPIGDGTTESVTRTGVDPDWDLSESLYIGRDGGTGTLFLEDGAQVTIDPDLGGTPSIYLGYRNGATGSLYVDGAATLLDVDSVIDVGYRGGSGYLEVRNGGTITGSLLHVSDMLDSNTSGEVLITGAGSSVELLNWVDVTGGGVLEVRDGGLLTTSGVRIAPSTDSSGELLVSGFNSRLEVADWVLVGAHGDGTLRVDDGGYLESLSGEVAINASSSSTVDLEGIGSTWRVLGDLSIAGDDTAGGTGTVNVVDNADLEVGGGITVWDDGELNVNAASVYADDITMAGGGMLTTNSTSSVFANTLTGFGDTPTFNGNLSLGHSGGHGDHAVGAGQSLTVGGALIVGEDSTAELTITGGGKVSSDIGVIGLYDPAHGEVTVSGAGSSFSVAQYLWMARNPGDVSGALNILDGGSVDVGDLITGNADVLITGEDSLLTATGDTVFADVTGSTATLEIADGAGLMTYGATLGDGFDSTGNALVTGAGSEWTNNGFLELGNTGAGHLTISDGGMLSTAGLRVGADGGPASSLLVEDGGVLDSSSVLQVTPDSTLSLTSGATGAATSATVNGQLTLSGVGTTLDLLIDVPSYYGALMVNGDSGGEVYVGEGAVLSSEEGYIGQLAGDASVVVDGSGSAWNLSGPLLRVGLGSEEGASASLAVRNGGGLQHAGDVQVVAEAGRSASVTVGGSGTNWSGDGGLHVGALSVDGETYLPLEGASSFQVSGGTVQMAGGTHLYGDGVFSLTGGSFATPTIDMTHGGEFALTGGMLTTQDIYGDLLNEGGSIVVGPDSPELYVDGDFTQDAGSLLLELDSSQGQQYLTTTGTFWAGGALAVLASTDFGFADGMVFDLLDFTAVGGVFDSVALPELDAGLLWDTSGLLRSGTIALRRRRLCPSLPHSQRSPWPGWSG